MITGMGIVSPIASNLHTFWSRLIQGTSGIGPISLFDSSCFPVRIAGEVRDFDFDRWIRKDPALKNAFRGSFFALQAAEEAFLDSHLRPFSIDRRRFGIYFGAGDSGIDFDAFLQTMQRSVSTGTGPLIDKGRYLEESSQHMNAIAELESQPFMTVTHLARRFDIRGPVSNCLTACAASSQAIGEASQLIANDEADLVLSGGAHSMIYPLGLAGFSLLTALSTQNAEPQKASRPFDLHRDGFVLGEGAGVVILEELGHAKKRKARIYGELVGYGSTSDAYRLTDMDPLGEGASRAMEIAMKKASVHPKDVDYINAHGTSTQVNDKMETLAIKKVMGKDAYRIPVSSIKSMLGHMIAAAGVTEVIACMLTMRDSMIPPTINYQEPDPDCDLDYVPNVARNQKVDVALSNSFGFGGQNICLAMRKYE